MQMMVSYNDSICMLFQQDNDCVGILVCIMNTNVQPAFYFQNQVLSINGQHLQFHDSYVITIFLSHYIIIICTKAYQDQSLYILYLFAEVFLQIL